MSVVISLNLIAFMFDVCNFASNTTHFFHRSVSKQRVHNKLCVYIRVACVKVLKTCLIFHSFHCFYVVCAMLYSWSKIKNEMKIISLRAIKCYLVQFIFKLPKAICKNMDMLNDLCVWHARSFGYVVDCGLLYKLPKRKR